MSTSSCIYCQPRSERVLWRDALCRIILADEPGFTGWCRVIWNSHVRELSDLDEAQLNHLMKVVSGTEAVLIADLSPAKMNIAALGTAAPHLHFHVIPRFADDPTFPDPVWTERRHANTRPKTAGIAERLVVALAARLGASRAEAIG